MTSRQLDWLAVQADWATTTDSVRQLAKAHGVSHTRIQQRARAEAWPARPAGRVVPSKRTSGNLPERGKVPSAGKVPRGGKSSVAAPAGVQFPIIVREWSKKGELARVTVDQYKGAATVNLRLWYQDKQGEWKPGPKGFVVGAAAWPEIAAEVNEVLARLGLLKGGEGGR